MKTKPYNLLSWRGKWARWRRNPSKWPHPGRTLAEIRAGIKARTERKKRPPKLPEFTMLLYCWWCGILLVKPLPCPDCGTPFDQAKSDAAAMRHNKGYVEYVREEAKKKGENPEQAVKEVRALRRYYR